ncbi:MAG: hypothetical protein R3Y11_08090 [Pseudomonadota bacterium]
MKRPLIIGLSLVAIMTAATYGAWYTGHLGPILRTVGLDSLAQIAEITQVHQALLDQQEKKDSAASSTHGANASGSSGSMGSTGSGGQNDSASGDAKDMEEAIGLALKGVNLVQGENGLELWRLKASWASLREEGGLIDVEMPDVVYRVGHAEIPLYVTAYKGQVDQKQQFLRLWEDVVCTYDDYTLHATLMTYDGQARIMTFPEGAHIESVKTKGFAHVLTWHLDTNIIEGMDGVTVSW